MATLFTKIINGEIPCYKVAENDDFFAFLDIFPVAKGHTLVIPKKEVDYIFDLDDSSYSGLQLFARKIAIALKKAIPCKKVGEMVLGLDVPHAHIHLVPMQSEADLLNFSKKISMNDEELRTTAQRIAHHLE